MRALCAAIISPSCSRASQTPCAHSSCTRPHTAHRPRRPKVVDQARRGRDLELGFGNRERGAVLCDRADGECGDAAAVPAGHRCICGAWHRESDPEHPRRDFVATGGLYDAAAGARRASVRRSIFAMCRLLTQPCPRSLYVERQAVLSSSPASASPFHETYEESLGQPVLNVRIVRPGSTLARGRPIMCGAITKVQQQ